MRNKLVDKILKETPEEVYNFVDLYTDIILKKYPQSELIEKIDKADLIGNQRAILFTTLAAFDLSEVDFSVKSRVHDWRNYIPEELTMIWKSLTDRERFFIYVMAQDRADLEDWD